MASEILTRMKSKPMPRIESAGAPIPPAKRATDNFPSTMSDVYRQTMGVPSPISLPLQSPDQSYMDRLLGFIRSLMQGR